MQVTASRARPVDSTTLPQRPNAAFAEHVDSLVAHVDGLSLKDSGDGLVYAALVHFRAGNRERSLALSDQSSWKDVAWPLQALLTHRGGDDQNARKTLQGAFDVANRHVTSWEERNRSALHGGGQITWFFRDWICFLTLLREAEETIEPSTTQFDALPARCEEIAKRKWTQSPETAAFDHALLFGSNNVIAQSRFPQPYLARGRRLAALGRFDEAEADLRMAAGLQPDNPRYAAAHAAFLADRGDIARAADLFAAALRQQSRGPRGRRLGDRGRVARRDDVLEILLQRPPQDGELHGIRGNALARQAAWDEAHAPIPAASRFGATRAPSPLCLCSWAMSRLSRSPVGDRRTCCGNSKRMNRGWLARGTWKPALRPVDAAEATELLGLLQQESGKAERPAQWWFAMGLAQYRGGQFEEAIATLLKARDPQGGWQQDARIWPVLAMAHWRLDRHDEARKWLAWAETWVDLTHRATELPRSIGDVPASVWLNAHVLYLEAKALIDGQAAASEVRQSLASRAERIARRSWRGLRFESSSLGRPPPNRLNAPRTTRPIGMNNSAERRITRQVLRGGGRIPPGRAAEARAGGGVF